MRFTHDLVLCTFSARCLLPFGSPYSNVIAALFVALEPIRWILQEHQIRMPKGLYNKCPSNWAFEGLRPIVLKWCAKLLNVVVVHDDR